MGAACSPVFDDTNLPDEPPLEGATVESIAITPGTPTVKRVLAPKKQLTAVATFSDSSTMDVTEKVSWSSSDSTIAAVSDKGEVSAVTAAGTTTITATLDGVSGTATLTAEDATLVVTSLSAGRFDFFSVYADGNVAPKKSIVGPSVGIPSGFGVQVVDNELYVAEYSGQGISVYSVDASGDTPPLRRIGGPLTKISLPYGIAVTKDEIYVCGAQSNILVFPRFANGNVAPIREIAGASTLLNGYQYQIYLHNNELFVATGNGNSVNVYPADATGDVAPIRRLVGGMTGFNNAESVVIKDNEMFVASTNRVAVFPVDATATSLRRARSRRTSASPPRCCSSATSSSIPTYSPGNAVVTHPVNATGTPTPLRNLVGAMTNITSPLGIWIY